MRNKTLRKIIIVVAIIFGGLMIRPAVYAVEKSETNDCINSATDGWVSCSLVDGMKNAIEGLYSWLIENWLAINPKLLSFTSKDDPGYSVFEAWKYFQAIADVALILYLMVIIISQVTGLGISNYGVKKALPRVVLAALLINLSYFICQAAIDLANIAGNGIFGILDKLIENAGIVATGANNTGYTVALLGILVVVVGVMVAWAAISPSFIMVVLWAFITAIIAVVFLFIVLGLRQVLSVLLVVVSPIAILCSTVPGLRGVYKKWLGLFKTALMAYPICSFMIGGGALASQILYDVWGGDENFFAAVGCLIICVAPFFFIPSVVKKSIGALDAMVDKVKNGSGAWKGVKGISQRALKGSDLNRSLENATQKKKIYRRAGIKSTFGGKVKRDANGNIVRTKHGGDARYYDKAFSQISRENDLEAFNANPNLIRQREENEMISQYEGAISGTGKSVADHAKDFAQLQSDFSAGLSAGTLDDRTIRESQAKMAAYTRILSGSAEGRSALRDRLNAIAGVAPGVTAPTPVNGFDSMTRAMFSGLSNDDVSQLCINDPLLGHYASRVRTEPLSSVGTFADKTNQTYTSEMLSFMHDSDFAALDDGIKQEMFAQAGATFSGNNLGSAFTVNDDSFATDLARLSSGVMGNNDSLASASMDAQAWMTGFVNQRNSQIETRAGTVGGTGYRGFANTPAGMAALKTAYTNAAAMGIGQSMEAAEIVLRERGATDADIEALRRSAEVANANAQSSVANRRRTAK